MSEGLDFTNDKETEELMNEIDKDADDWEKITEPEIVTEINLLADQIEKFAVELQKMIKNNDYDTVRELLNSLMSSRLGENGWIGKFMERNRSILPKSTGDDSRPAYVNANPELIKQYDMVARYYKDLLFTYAARVELVELLKELKLMDGFIVKRLTDNFKEAGFDEDIYSRINGEIRDVYERVSLGFIHWEYLADRAERYYQENFGKIPNNKLNEQYRKLRLQAYLEDVKRQPFFTNSFTVDSAGYFSVKPVIYARMHTIDRYTEVAACMENIESAMNKTMNDCKRIYDEDIHRYDQGLIKTQAGISLIGSLHWMQDKISWFAYECLTEYQAYTKPEDKAPYCFMKKLPVLDEIQGSYMRPDKGDPRVAGTHFRDLYEKAASALTTHLMNFVYNYGHPEIR